MDLISRTDHLRQLTCEERRWSATRVATRGQEACMRTHASRPPSPRLGGPTLCAARFLCSTIRGASFGQYNVKCYYTFTRCSTFRWFCYICTESKLFLFVKKYNKWNGRQYQKPPDVMITSKIILVTPGQINAIATMSDSKAPHRNRSIRVGATRPQTNTSTSLRRGLAMSPL